MRRLHRHAVHNRIHGHTRQSLLLVQRDAQAIERIQNSRIHLLQALRRVRLTTRRRIIAQRLKINIRHLQMPPPGRRQRPPMLVGTQTKIKQPLRLALLLRNQTHDIRIQAPRNDIRIDIAHKAILILAAHSIAQSLVRALSRRRRGSLALASPGRISSGLAEVIALSVYIVSILIHIIQ